jgi:outer membrane protein assembly factor BamA
MRTILSCVVVLAALASADISFSAKPNLNSDYTLRGITFRNNRVIRRADVLRSQIPLRDGQKFDVSRLRAGLNRIRDVYGEFGYIQATCATEFVTDNKSHAVSVVVSLDEGRVFFIRSVSVLGLERDVTDDLARLSLERGKVYNQRIAELFFKARAPRAVVKSTPRSRILLRTENTASDETTGTVDVIFDFRPTDAR